MQEKKNFVSFVKVVVRSRSSSCGVMGGWGSSSSSSSSRRSGSSSFRGRRTSERAITHVL